MKVTGERQGDGVKLIIKSSIRSEGALFIKIGFLLSKYNLSEKDIRVTGRTAEIFVQTHLAPSQLVDEVKRVLPKSKLTRR